jgi:hypothetical protein
MKNKPRQFRAGADLTRSNNEVLTGCADSGKTCLGKSPIEKKLSHKKIIFRLRLKPVRERDRYL